MQRDWIEFCDGRKLDMVQMWTSTTFCSSQHSSQAFVHLYLYLGAAEFWWKIEWENGFKGWKVNIRTKDPVTDFVFIPWHFDLCFHYFFFKVANIKETSRLKQRNEQNLNTCYSIWENKELLCIPNLVIRLLLKWTSFWFLSQDSPLFPKGCYPRPRGPN